MNYMGRMSTLAAVSIVVLAGGASAQVQPEAKQKLQEMADAFRNTQSLSFSASLLGTGGFMAMLPEMKGEVVMARAEKPGAWRIRVEGERGEGMGSPAMRFILVSDGQRKTWIDHQAKTVFDRPSNAARGEQVDVGGLVIPREFMAAEPFASQLAAPKIELEAEPATADGVPCDVILVDLGENQHKYRWCIAQGDHLPRKVQQIYVGGGDMSQTWSMRNVKVNLPTESDLWKINTPEGYTFSGAPAPVAHANQGATPGAPVASGPKQRTIGLEVDNLAPEFELADEQGAPFRLSGQRGKVVLVEFWNTWVPLCKTAAPEVQKIADRYKEQPVVVVGLSCRERSAAAPAAYMKENGFTFGHLPGADEVATLYKVRQFPTFFVIGKEGQVVHSGAGFDDATAAELIEAIEGALAGTDAERKPAAAPAAPGEPSGSAPASQPPPPPPASDGGKRSGPTGEADERAAREREARAAKERASEGAGRRQR